MDYTSTAPNDPLVGNLQPDGTPPPSRIKDPAALHDVYIRLKQSDDVNARNRAEVDAMFDGAAPYDEQQLQQGGMGSRCNLNFGEAESILETALAGYIDLINSVETLVQVSVKEDDENLKAEYEDVIAEGFTKMLREWDEFSPKYMLNANYFVKHGVSVAFFDDEFDWRFQVSKIGDFLLPRRTFASEECIEVAISPRTMRAHELYQFIKDAERAEDLGWDLEETRKAIIANTGSQSTYHITDWERYEEDLKNNDIFVAHGSGSEIRVIHAWVREFDGTISYYISLADNSNESFLYQQRSRFSKATDAFVTFTYGVGTNGFYQSIRGLGYKIFPHIQVSNRMRCQFIDGAMLSTSLLIQPEDESQLEDLAFEYMGPFSVLTAGVNIVDKELPNIGQNAIPVLQDMTEQLNRRAGAYGGSSAAGAGNGSDKTQLEVQSQLQSDARLTSGAMNLFYEPWTRLLRAMFKRATREDYLTAERGGQQVHAFWKYCSERGVPLEILFNHVEEVAPVRALGNGSEQLRLLALNEFTQLMGEFDEQGRQNLLRDRIAARANYDRVNRYVPRTPGSRPTLDQSIADLENGAFLAGKDIQPLPNQNHFVHATSHTTDITKMAQAVQQGQIDPQHAVAYFQLAYPHVTQHMQKLASDASRKEQYAKLKQALQQAGEIAEQTSEKVQAAQQKQAAAAQQPQQQGPVGPDPETIQRIQSKQMEHQADLKMTAERHEQQLTLQAAEAHQKSVLRDAEMAAKIRKLPGKQPI